MIERLDDRARNWGSTQADRALDFPCDRFVPDGETYFRAIDVDAPAATVFRWLCQMRIAPYSYDSLDNFGRRSPRELMPGLDELELGQRFMTIFDLVDFVEDEQLTLDVRRLPRYFGPASVTYRVERRGPEASRLIVKLRLGDASRSSQSVRGRLMPFLELFMMRRQLMNLRALAEGTHRAG